MNVKNKMCEKFACACCSKIWASRFIFHVNCSSISIRDRQKFRGIDRPIMLAHPTHPSFCDTVISGAPFRVISARDIRANNAICAGAYCKLLWENNRGDVFYWTDISTPWRLLVLFPILGYRRDRSKTSLIWPLWGKRERSLSMEYDHRWISLRLPSNETNGSYLNPPSFLNLRKSCSEKEFV